MDRENVRDRYSMVLRESEPLYTVLQFRFRLRFSSSRDPLLLSFRNSGIALLRLFKDLRNIRVLHQRSDPGSLSLVGLVIEKAQRDRHEPSRISFENATSEFWRRMPRSTNIARPVGTSGKAEEFWQVTSRDRRR